jgi:hypothetical protein
MLAWDIKQGMLMRDFTLPANKNIFSKTTLNSTTGQMALVYGEKLIQQDFDTRMLTHDSNQIYCKEAAIDLRPLSMVSNTYCMKNNTD